MSVTAEQCRAARALLDWSQVDLSERAHVSKKTIADFERGHRAYHGRTSSAVEATLQGHGVEFIPENGGGPGVRLRKAMPRLFRRDEVPHRAWVAFAFDYKARRYTGFVRYDALASIGDDLSSPLESFDENRGRILITAAERVDSHQFDADGRVLLDVGDLPPIAFDAGPATGPLAGPSG